MSQRNREKRKLGIRWCWNGWLSLGLHIDHLDPSITIHTPIIIFSIGNLKQNGLHKFNRIEERQQ